ncbi:CYTOSOL-AP domain-containing protein [Aphelenchoides bicaudatus]|nr:CYTOSOL-AP domain-containing protein [Aphelenchoides bicaudatus]
MSSFSVSSGLNKNVQLPDSQVVLVGRHKHLKSVNFTDLREKLQGVDERVFKAAVDQLQSDGDSVPLYLDSAKLIAVKDEVSRHNSPANGTEIYKQLSALKLVKGVKNLNIVLYAEYQHVFASVAAIVRSFPTFKRKEKAEDLESIQVEFLQTLADSIRTVARQVDTPCNEFHTEIFADEAIRQVEALNAGVTRVMIKGEDLKAQGFGGIYNVGKAARNPPIFLCLSYKPAGSTESYALVGKGIVYDTGGLSLKTPQIMPTMKLDMGGAAALLGAFCALVKSGFKQEIHCLLCMAENHISPDSVKPDDIIKMLSGKFVEVNNTDAEGRLVLSDGVYYAKNTLNAQNIIVCATLTGAQKFVTGVYHSAILSNDEETELETVKAGKRSGDLVHPLLYCPELHFGDFKSKVADMKNACTDPKGPPTATAGLFAFSHIDFAKDVRFLHLDIAYPAFQQERATAAGMSVVVGLLAKHTDVEVAK